KPEGNRSQRYSPHGSYRCLDEGGMERWIAIAVQDDAEWHAFLHVVGDHPGPDEFVTQLDRLLRFTDVDRYVQARVSDRKADDLPRGLQEAGVAAYPVQSCLDLRVDENMEAFGFWEWLDHRECGPMPYDGLPYRLCRTPSELKAAPCIGEHTEAVLGD